MFEKSNLKKCKSCGQDFARTVNECPHCGQNMRTGLLLKLSIGIGALAVLCTFAIPVYNNPIKDRQRVLTQPVDPINASDLAKMFNKRHKPTNIQLENELKRIEGKVVQWQLPVFVVSSLPDYYSIVTKQNAEVPATLLTVYPSNDREKEYLESIKPGTTITIKGKIAGTLKGRIKINPAFLF